MPICLYTIKKIVKVKVIICLKCVTFFMFSKVVGVNYIATVAVDTLNRKKNQMELMCVKFPINAPMLNTFLLLQNTKIIIKVAFALIDVYLTDLPQPCPKRQ